MASSLLLLLLLLLLLSTSATAVSATSTTTTTISHSTLDPKQLKALQSLDVPTATDPCIASSTTPREVVTVCDTSSPFRHLLQLHLLNCSSDLSVSLTALQSLATLQSLSFTNCPSLSATGFYVIFSHIHSLKSVTISNASINGPIPNSLPHNLTHLDFSGNKLEGGIPDSISALSGLIHLDLSSNQLNGTVPGFLSNLKELRYLNLEKNELHGILPFNDTFVNRLLVFKVDGNSNLCYNDSILSSKLKLGIAKCDQHGLPARDSTNDEGTTDDDEEDDERKQRLLFLWLFILIWLLLGGSTGR